jgi:photosynthetic reaction center cytochrome c subunit
MKIGPRRVILAAAVAVASMVGIALVASGAKISARPTVASLGQSNKTTARPDMILPVRGIGELALASAQAPPQAAATPGLQKAEEVFKNIQVLKGISVDDFMGSMGVMSASLGFCCSECHTGAGTDTVKWDVDTPNKITARKMVLMVAAINKDNFGGQQVVTCWTCHRGRDRPVVTPSLDTVYGDANLEADDLFAAAPGAPPADQVLDKYIQAVGGAQRLNGITSYAAQGTSIGFAEAGGGGRVEIFAKFPDQRATYIHFADPQRGDSTRTFDGKGGWIATPLTVVRRYPLGGGELEGAKLDAELAFPAQIKQLLTRWRSGPISTINNREVDVLQGTGAGGFFATFYFDKETGLLTRLVRYSRSPIGRVPTQVDYADYRDVGGIKIPFRWTFSWLDGRDSFQLTNVQLNAPVDAAKFGIPPIPPPLPQ